MVFTHEISFIKLDLLQSVSNEAEQQSARDAFFLHKNPCQQIFGTN